MAARRMELWGAETARTLRPIWMAEELGLDYKLHAIGARTGETQSAAFTALTRKQKIPFLVDGEIRMSESLAICRYLQHAYASNAVAVPDTMRARAAEDEWCCYIYGELDETALYVMRRHGDLKEIYGAAPAVLDSAKTYLMRHLDVLEHHLKGRDSVLEIGFGLADIMLVSCLDWAVFYGVAVPSAVLAYREQIAARPAYKKAMAINYAILFGGKAGGKDGTA